MVAGEIIFGILVVGVVVRGLILILIALSGLFHPRDLLLIKKIHRDCGRTA